MSANDKQVGGEHYQRPIQHWDYVVANKMPYLDAQAFRYIDRHARKNGKQDLEKAIHFIEKMIETYYPDPMPFPTEVEDKFIDICPHQSQGLHSWSSMYRHGEGGRLVAIYKCDHCQEEREKV